jgi:putative DNA primase/helicase
MIVLKDRERAAAKQVFSALGGMRLGEDAFLCHCPCSLHKRGDLNPSLSVKDGPNGRLLLHCFADGDYADVVAGLKAKGLRL